MMLNSLTLILTLSLNTQELDLNEIFFKFVLFMAAGFNTLFNAMHAFFAKSRFFTIPDVSYCSACFTHDSHHDIKSVASFMNRKGVITTDRVPSIQENPLYHS